jgi:membrane dipeptidase
MADRAAGLHREALVLDSLTPIYTLDPPYTERLLDGGVGAGFLSVMSDVDWDEAMRRMEMVLAKIERSPHLRLVLNADDFAAARAEGKIGLMLVTQAADMVGARLERVSTLHRLGLRCLGLCYTFANLYGDGCGELRDAGLTFLGRELIEAVNELPMLLDLSHSGHRTTEEAIALARNPCVTHASAHAVVANDRNKKDAAIRALAAKGGVIGACALPRAVRPEAPTLEHFLDHIDHLIALVGADHVGIGLDYTQGYKDAGQVLPQSRRNRTLRPDIFGSVEDFLHQPYPQGIERIEQAPAITAGLLARGHGPEVVHKVWGLSWVEQVRRVIG